jgi:hypothetical protein
MTSVPYENTFVKFLEIPFAHVNKLCNDKRCPIAHQEDTVLDIQLHALTWVLDGDKWSASGCICISLFMDPGGLHTWFGLLHVGTNLLFMQVLN